MALIEQNKNMAILRIEFHIYDVYRYLFLKVYD